DVARAAEADGVHLGQDDLPVAAARRVLGAGRRIGVSTHDLEQARAAEAAGADYIAVGPVYATTTKPDALAPRGLALVSAVRAAVRCPLVAIGGITPETAAAVRAAGADAVAMIGALVRAPDPEAAVRDAPGRRAAARGHDADAHEAELAAAHPRGARAREAADRGRQRGRRRDGRAPRPRLRPRRHGRRGASRRGVRPPRHRHRLGRRLPP